MDNHTVSKHNTMVCPRCGRMTSFNMLSDAIDELGEFYRCQHCGWVFNYRQYYLYRQNNTRKKM